MCLQCGPLIKAIEAYIAKADDDLKDELEAAGYVEPEKTMGYLEAIEDGIANALLAETACFLVEIQAAPDLGAFAKKIWPKVKRKDPAKKEIAAVVAENLDRLVPECVERYIARTDPELGTPMLSKRTAAWVRSWSKQLGEIMQLNSHQEIEDILVKGLEEGISIDEFTRRIQESGIRDEYYKARRVAITEVLRAHNAAHQEAAMQSPSVVGKEWQHTGAHRNQPRQNHIDMDGQRVPKEEPYTLIGADGNTYHPMYPLDPILPPGESVNCKCNFKDITDAEILGLPLEERKRLQQEAIDSMDAQWEHEREKENREKAGIQIEPFARSVSRKYQDRATPGSGKIIQPDNYKTGKHREEIAMAATLQKTFGGDITLLTEASEMGVSTPDYKWNGSLWELKSPKSEKKGDDLLRTARKQIERNPGGVIMNYQVDRLDMGKATEALMSRFQREDFPLKLLDVMICHKGDIIDIIRFEK